MTAGLRFAMRALLDDCLTRIAISEPSAWKRSSDNLVDCFHLFWWAVSALARKTVGRGETGGRDFFIFVLAVFWRPPGAGKCRRTNCNSGPLKHKKGIFREVVWCSRPTCG